MVKVMFVCHGNICRSVMAEAIFRDIVNRENLDFYVSSSATSTEEIGNSPDKRAIGILEENSFDTKKLLKFKLAKQLKPSDYEKFDYFFVMDDFNLKNISKIFDDKDNKVYKIFDFAKGENKNIKDPWYSFDFNKTFEELNETIKIIVEKLKNKN